MLSILMSTHELAQPPLQTGEPYNCHQAATIGKLNPNPTHPNQHPTLTKTKDFTIITKQFDTNVPFSLWCPWDVVCWSLGVMRSRQSGSRSVESSCSDALDSGTDS